MKKVCSANETLFLKLGSSGQPIFSTTLEVKGLPIKNSIVASESRRPVTLMGVPKVWDETFTQFKDRHAFLSTFHILFSIDLQHLSYPFLVQRLLNASACLSFGFATVRKALVAFCSPHRLSPPEVEPASKAFIKISAMCNKSVLPFLTASMMIWS